MCVHSGCCLSVRCIWVLIVECPGGAAVFGGVRETIGRVFGQKRRAAQATEGAKGKGAAGGQTRRAARLQSGRIRLI